MYNLGCLKLGDQLSSWPLVRCVPRTLNSDCGYHELRSLPCTAGNQDPYTPHLPKLHRTSKIYARPPKPPTTDTKPLPSPQRCKTAIFVGAFLVFYVSVASHVTPTPNPIELDQLCTSTHSKTYLNSTYGTSVTLGTS